MKVNEEACADDVPSGTRVVSGRCVETMKTLTVWRAKWTVRGYEEPHSGECCLAATASIQGVRMVLSRCADMRDKGYDAFVGDYTQAFLNAEVRDGEQLFALPPEGRKPNHLLDGRRVVWRVRKALPGLRTSPRRWQEYLTKISVPTLLVVRSVDGGVRIQSQFLFKVLQVD